MPRRYTPRPDQNHPKICGFLVPAFIGLNMLRFSADMCKTLKLPTNAVCGSESYMRELDNHALCAVFCCCKDRGNQACMRDVIWESDTILGRHSYYKAEVPYDTQLTWELMSNPKTGLERRSRPDGARIPDIIIVKNPNQLATLDNVERAIEVKFPNDSFTDKLGKDDLTQLEAYTQLFGGKLDTESISNDQCGCDDEEKRKQHNLVLENARQYYEDQSPAKLLETALVPIQRGALGMAKRAYQVLDNLLKNNGLIFAH